MPDADFAAGRAAVLRDLLAKPTLFHTEAARTRWEQIARANVQREIDALRRSRSRQAVIGPPSTDRTV